MLKGGSEKLGIRIEFIFEEIVVIKASKFCYIVRLVSLRAGRMGAYTLQRRGSGKGP